MEDGRCHCVRFFYSLFHPEYPHPTVHTNFRLHCTSTHTFSFPKLRLIQHSLYYTRIDFLIIRHRSTYCTNFRRPTDGKLVKDAIKILFICGQKSWERVSFHIPMVFSYSDKLFSRTLCNLI